MKKLMALLSSLVICTSMVSSFTVGAEAINTSYNTVFVYSETKENIDENIAEFLKSNAANDELGIMLNAEMKSRYENLIEKKYQYLEPENHYIPNIGCYMGIIKYENTFGEEVYMECFLRTKYNDYEQILICNTLECVVDWLRKDSPDIITPKEYNAMEYEESLRFALENKESSDGYVFVGAEDSRDVVIYGKPMSPNDILHSQNINTYHTVFDSISEIDYKEFVKMGITINDIKQMTKIIIAGDANEDGYVDISDSIAVMQSIANPDVYPLTLQGQLNADMDANGVTAKDALLIQQKLLAR